MQSVPVYTLPLPPRIRTRTALVTSADLSFRQRLAEILTGLRWQVREAASGAQAWAEAEATAPEAIVVDSWLPDLELAEFLKDFRKYFPGVDLVTTGAASVEESPRGPYRQELLYAARRPTPQPGTRRLRWASSSRCAPRPPARACNRLRRIRRMRQAPAGAALHWRCPPRSKLRRSLTRR